MSKIHRLPNSLIAKIAAGEIIERPAYAVKELIDNSLDAGATQIDITIRKAGLEEITIVDNGHGMTAEELVLSIQNHTTSKLQIDSDLSAIISFGYRGEALASMAAAGDLIISSRVQDASSGYQLSSSQTESTPIGMPVGTQVTVHNLFHHLPARLKFLKSPAGEFRLLLNQVVSLALSHPQVSFSLKHNRKIIFHWPAQTLEQRLKHFFQDQFQQLLPVTEQTSYLKLTGYLGHPQFATKNPQQQFLYINHRPINDRRISQIINHHFRTLIPKTHLPSFWIDIEIPYHLVDVNIHPRKEQVGLANAEELYRQFDYIIEKTLADSQPAQNSLLSKYFQDPNQLDSYAALYLKDQELPWELPELKSEKASEPYQYQSLFIINPTKNGLEIIDQHAAHERILYQQFIELFSQSKNQTFKLDQPLSIQLNYLQQQTLKDNLQKLEDLRFYFELFGPNNYRLTEVPLIYQDYNLESLIPDLISEISDQTIKDQDAQTERLITFLACRRAIKAGNELSVKQMIELVNKLHQTKNYQTCPHGRPTILNISLAELLSAFKR